MTGRRTGRALVAAIVAVALVPADASPQRRDRKRPSKTVDPVFSTARYPDIRSHFLDVLDRGWPRILVINRKGADERRDKLLEDIPTRPGFDRDEYPPQLGAGPAARGSGGGERSDRVAGIGEHVRRTVRTVRAGRLLAP